ncbi:MAG: hypothetical protein JNK45_25515 [Myxococcales bacterium]|nr:hypothetical protein [Myxococcales bacterium]
MTDEPSPPRHVRVPSRFAPAVCVGLVTACGDAAGGGDGTGGTEIGPATIVSTEPGDVSTAPSTSSATASDDTGGTDDDGESTGDVLPPTTPLAGGIGLVTVELNQGVGIHVVADGAPRSAETFAVPVIAGRPALVRADHVLATDFTPREIDAYLEIEHADGTVSNHLASRSIDGPADFASLDGGFTWRLDAEDTAGATGMRVSLRETGDEPVGSAMPSASIPADGFLELGAWQDPMVLEVMVVPLSCDGIPAVEVSDADLADLEAYLFNTYPVTALTVHVHDPVASPSCNEFDAAEYELPAVRQADDAAPWVYYGGLLPTDAGGYSISIEGGDQMDYRRTFANGTWRDYGLTFDLFAHELGHNHGRPHTFEDDGYPGENTGNCGTLDTWGWGVVSGLMPQSGYSNDQDIGIPWVDANAMLIPPTGSPCDGLPSANQGSFSDMMSYAYPYWVSAYTYRAVAERVRVVGAWSASTMHTSGLQEFDVVRATFDPDGRIRTTRSAGRLHGTSVVARCTGANGPIDLPARRSTAVHDLRMPDGSLRAWHYDSVEVEVPRARDVVRCEVTDGDGALGFAVTAGR